MMDYPLRYTPNDDEAHAAWTVAQRRNSLNGGGTNLPTGETADETERLRQHYAACLAEIAVSRMANLCWTGCGIGANGALDVGGIYEVRSVTEAGRGLLVRSKDFAKGDPPFVLVFVNLPNRACTILGWQRPSVVRDRGRALDADSASPCWIMPPDDLYPWPVSRVA